MQRVNISYHLLIPRWHKQFKSLPGDERDPAIQHNHSMAADDTWWCKTPENQQSWWLVVLMLYSSFSTRMVEISLKHMHCAKLNHSWPSCTHVWPPRHEHLLNQLPQSNMPKLQVFCTENFALICFWYWTYEKSQQIVVQTVAQGAGV